MAKNEVAVFDKFQLVTGFEDMDEDLKAELEDEMDDLDDDGGIDAKHIKIPSGGGKAFEVETDDPDDPEVMKEIQGVILFSHNMNAYWKHRYGETDENGNANKVPDCASMDGDTGVDRTTGEIKDCSTCPFNQFGSDDSGRGKACRNMRRFYLMMSGRPDIYLLTVPPSSRRDVNRSLREMMARRFPYTQQVASFKLIVAESADKIKYSRVTLERAGMLPAALFPITQGLRAELKKNYESVSMAADDFVPRDQDGSVPAQEKGPQVPEGWEPAPDAPDRFMNIPTSDGEQEELPFE